MSRLWVDREALLDTGISQILETDIVLDIGCGIMPHNYITPYIYICCEPFKEYVTVLEDKIKSNTESIFIVLNYDWEKVIEEFDEKSVDTVFLIDVIEHLDKHTGVKLLQLTERIAKRQVVIFTPLGFVEQKTLHGGKDAWGLNGAAWQEHKSGWFPEDFDESWDIIACKDFHVLDNTRQQLDEPFGAFWAIKNINEDFGNSVYPNRHLMKIFFEQGKHTFRMLKHEKDVLVEKKAILENEKDILVNENIAFYNRYRFFEDFRKSKTGRIFITIFRKVITTIRRS